MAGPTIHEEPISTANVLALVLAETKRQDDMRESQAARTSEVSTLAREYEQKLRDAEVRRVDGILVAESQRLDALLDAQKNDVAIANEKSAAQAATLAAQLVASAEAVRTQVSTTAAAMAAQTGTPRESLEKRLVLVEQNQYLGAGETMIRTAGRQQSQWVVGVVIGACLVIAEILSRLLR